jgi:hypothetical protein
MADMDDQDQEFFVPDFADDWVVSHAISPITSEPTGETFA